jgi:replicative DNA helicase
MLKQEFTLKSPLRILQKATRGGLGKGNLGVFMARAGVGKTACLIHVALDSLFKNQKAVHVGIGESVEEIQVWYREILSDLCTSFDIQDPKKIAEELERQRIILSYTPETFTVRKLARDLEDLSKDGGFLPEILLIDGFEF